MSDDEYEIPLVDQRYFGAGIKRKRVHFVPSAQTEPNPVKRPPANAEFSAADRYLSIVLGQTVEPVEVTSSNGGFEGSKDGEVTQAAAAAAVISNAGGHQNATCDICNRPIVGGGNTQRHELSLMHQICLKHSHPPSHIDRSSKALALLQNQGWDPDSRLGLGATGEGILHPLKAKDNPQRTGLGAVLSDVQVKPKAVKLDAGKVRKLEQKTHREKAKLRELFYQNEDIERYLGEK